MGGFFSTPSAPDPVSIPATTDPEEEARQQRLETMARNRRGRAGMIATSERGVLGSTAGGTKSLLGE